MNQLQSPWNSLEVAKLIVSVLTPLLLLTLGLWTSRVVKRLEAAQWANQKVVEKRLAIFDKTAPLMNDLYCFHVHVGHWKELTPKHIIDTKRKLDKHMHVNAALFTSEFFNLYTEFIGECFENDFSDVGADAKIKACAATYERYTIGEWDPSWNEMFMEKDNGEKVHAAYKTLMARFAVELGVGLGSTWKRS